MRQWLARPWVLGALIVLWLGAIGACLWGAIGWEITPGRAASAPASWPDGSTLVRSSGQPVLVVFAHPRCACSQATLSELSALLSSVHRPLTVEIAFLKPAGVPAGWERTDVWASAIRIPGVTVVADEGGREAARFGAHTSGQSMLYDAAGRLRFCGGLTGLRGHPGDNAGRSRLLALLESRTPDQSSSKVFGCALADGKAR